MGSILDGSLDSGWKCRDGDLLAVGALFLRGPIFLHHHTRRRQIQDLTPLSSTGCHHLQVLLASLTLFYWQLDDLIWRGRELQARSQVSWLPSRFLLALLAQAFRFAHKTIRGGRQVAIVAIFRELVSQSFHVLAQAAHLLLVVLDHGVLFREQCLLLLDKFVSLRQSFPQHLILFSQPDQFFFDRHARTFLGLTPFGKSPANLGSYPFCVNGWPSLPKRGRSFTQNTRSHLLHIHRSRLSLPVHPDRCVPELSGRYNIVLETKASMPDL